jgi:CRP-like cAMP-binding protein
MATRPTDPQIGADRSAVNGLVLCACKSARRIEIADKGPLYMQGEPATAVFFILDGFAKVSHLAEDGAEITTELLKGADIAGPLPQSAKSCHVHEDQARAIGPLVALRVDSSELFQAMQTNAQLVLLSVAYLTRSKQASQRRIVRAMTQPVSRRVTETLVELAHTFGARCPHGFSLEIKLTQEDIAGLIGASRSVVSTVLNELRSRGLLDYTRDMICVNDRALALFAKQTQA